MPKAQLFITCLGDQFYTSTLQNMILLLERPVALNFMQAFTKSDAPIIWTIWFLCEYGQASLPFFVQGRNR